MKTELRTDITVGDICKGFQYNEYEGKGRVVAQTPKPEELLQKGTTCKLTLKERG